MKAEFVWHGDRVREAILDEMRRRAKAVAEGIAQTARESAPIRTGALVASITVVEDASDPDAIRFDVVAESDHAAATELGHATSRGFVPPQPFLRNSVIKNQPEAQRILGRKL